MRKTVVHKHLRKGRPITAHFRSVKNPWAVKYREWSPVPGGHAFSPMTAEDLPALMKSKDWSLDEIKDWALKRKNLNLVDDDEYRKLQAEVFDEIKKAQLMEEVDLSKKGIFEDKPLSLEEERKRDLGFVEDFVEKQKKGWRRMK